MLYVLSMQTRISPMSFRVCCLLLCCTWNAFRCPIWTLPSLVDADMKTNMKMIPASASQRGVSVYGSEVPSPVWPVFTFPRCFCCTETAYVHFASGPELQVDHDLFTRLVTFSSIPLLSNPALMLVAGSATYLMAYLSSQCTPLFRTDIAPTLSAVCSWLLLSLWACVDCVSS